MAWSEKTIKANKKAHERVRSGLCIICGRPRNLYAVHCDPCAAAFRHRQRERLGLKMQSRCGRPIGSTRVRKALGHFSPEKGATGNASSS